MATWRERPYAQFNFLVELGTDSIEAGFEEVSGLGMEVADEQETSVRTMPALTKTTDVTLKRGVIGSLNLSQWLDQIHNGDPSALRTVVIKLQSEDHTAVVRTWKLLRARVIKYTSGPFNARGTDIAIEEMTLSYESLEVE